MHSAISAWVLSMWSTNSTSVSPNSLMPGRCLPSLDSRPEEGEPPQAATATRLSTHSSVPALRFVTGCDMAGLPGVRRNIADQSTGVLNTT